MNSKPVIVIIGGGFGGIELIKSLKGSNYEIYLLDRHNYHTFQPLLYQVASGGLDTGSIAYPFRKLFSGRKEFHFRMTEVKEIISSENVVDTSIGRIKYDVLVLATGSKTNFFGMKQVEALSMPMKTIPDALNLRSDILQEFEEALLVSPDRQRTLMNFVIVGGGPTGVETAGALAEFKKYVLEKDYPELDKEMMQVHLIEASPKLLAAMSEESSKKSFKFLSELGVDIRLNTSVKDYDGETVFLSSGDTLKSNTLIWSAGVAGALISGIGPESLAGNRYKVDELNRVAGTSNIYAIGDCAAMITPELQRGHPMVAQVAMQQGKNLGKNLKKSANEKWKVFKYKDLGSMATVGRNKAVVDLPFIKFQGFFAWFVWMFVHLMSLVSFRNRLITLMAWTWSYFSYENALRLIIRPFRR